MSESGKSRLMDYSDFADGKIYDLWTSEQRRETLNAGSCMMAGLQHILVQDFQEQNTVQHTEFLTGFYRGFIRVHRV